MFDLPAAWEMPINLIFLGVTGFIAWHGVRYRDPDGNPDTVRLLFGCIAAMFFLRVLLVDVFELYVF